MIEPWNSVTSCGRDARLQHHDVALAAVVGHHVGAVAGAEQVAVGAGAALQHVVAGAAVEHVGADAAREPVVAGAAEQDVGVGGVARGVRVVVAEQVVVAVAARDRLGAGAADQHVVAVGRDQGACDEVRGGEPVAVVELDFVARRRGRGGRGPGVDLQAVAGRADGEREIAVQVPGDIEIVRAEPAADVDAVDALELGGDLAEARDAVEARAGREAGSYRRRRPG